MTLSGYSDLIVGKFSFEKYISMKFLYLFKCNFIIIIFFYQKYVFGTLQLLFIPLLKWYHHLFLFYMETFVE